MNNMKYWLVMTVCGSALTASAQLTVDNSQTPQDLVENVLLGGGVTVSNVMFNGLPGTTANPQIGTFDGTATPIGMDSGILLSSGDINVAIGPNNSGGLTLGAGSGPGDPDLTQLLNSGGGAYTTNDAAVLEFDFVPSGDSLSFNFIFGSEEYLEWVGSSFNDVFGFFISGPGFSGPYSGGAENIALVPGLTIPVTIDNVNNVNNSTYYVDNGDGSTAPFNTDPQYIQFDGYTTVLTANAIVQCGQTYHIKIAVADAGDWALDSGVFLEAGSFSSPNAIEIEVVTASADGTLTEGCTDAIFTISRPGSEDSIEVSVTVGGTAINGTDYSAMPSVITIPADSNSVSFPVSAFEDGLPEGAETIILTATFVNACGDTSISTATVPIVDYVPIVLVTSDTATGCVEELVAIGALATGGFGELNFAWNDGTPGSTLLVPGDADGTYTVTVTDECEKSVSAEVFVDSGCEIIIPNVFSPNNDGENDEFVIQGILGTVNSVKVFNRWGQIVFEANNYKNNWDGRDVSDGTYFYEVIVQDEPNSPFTGHLTILNTGN
jgi:gliding motility-associated-like protein